MIDSLIGSIFIGDTNRILKIVRSQNAWEGGEGF
jgi:hypothetical protein